MKRQIYIPSIANFFVPERQGQSAGRLLRRVALVVGLSMLVFAAVAFGTTAAAGPAILITPPNPDTPPCWAVANETALDRNYGTFAGCWQTLMADATQVGGSYGTAAGLRTAYIDPEIAFDPNQTALDRNYGTFTGLWTAYMEREAAADPNQVALDRSYGTFTSVWLADLADR